MFKKLFIKMSFWVIAISIASGYSLNLDPSLIFLRTLVFYLIFSVLILLIFLVFNQRSYGMLKTQLEKETKSGQEDMRAKT